MHIDFKEGTTEIGKLLGNSQEDNKKLTSISTPSTLEIIYKESFISCSNLKDVKLNEGLKVIGREAFRGTAIEYIDIPDSCFVINDKAFMDCKNLKSIAFPEGVEEIKPSVCSGCSNLETIYLPSTLQKIALDSFENCPNIKEVFFAGAQEKGEAFKILIQDMNSLDKKLEHFNTNKLRKQFTPDDLIKENER